MRTFRVLFGISAAASLIFLLARPLSASEWPVILKGVSILLLSVLGFRINALLGAALACSLIGDVLLGVQRLGSLEEESLFLLGLGSFLIAHLLYIAMYVSYGALVRRKLSAVRMCGVSVILVALGVMLRILWPSLGSMRAPVLAYSIVLCGMGIGAMLARLGNPWAGLGAMFFVASDAMIAISRFRSPFPGNEQWIWITYYLAQSLILYGVEARDSKAMLARDG